MTTSSHEAETKKKTTTKTEFTSPSKVRTARKSSLPGPKKTRQTEKLEGRQQEAKAKKFMEMKKRKQCKLKLRTPGRKVQDAAAAAARSRLRLKVKRSSHRQYSLSSKRTRSPMNSSERIEEMFSEVQQVAWDAISISETWRQGKKIWETQQGHIMVESGKFKNKHGVATIVEQKM